MLGDFITGSGSSARAETTRERKKKKKRAHTIGNSGSSKLKTKMGVECKATWNFSEGVHVILIT